MIETNASCDLPTLGKCHKHQEQDLNDSFNSNTTLNVDIQLAEELASCTYTLDSCDFEPSSPVSPVPLITPPASPIHHQCDDNEFSICEWPSNLVIGNALTAISELRPPSLSEVLDCNEPFIMSPKSVCSDMIQ